MSLSNLYTELHRRAALTGEDRALDLKGGARLSVRVRDDVTTITIARKGKKLAATEIVTFQQHCGVPANAVRFPQEGQNTREAEGATWSYVAFRWREESPQ